MSEKEWLFRVRDMLKCIEEIETFTADLDIVTFAEDRKSYKATERNLEIIAEASKHLPDAVKQAYAHVGWKKIVGFRNVISHSYDKVEEDVVWLVVQRRLPELKTVLIDILKNKG